MFTIDIHNAVFMIFHLVCCGAPILLALRLYTMYARIYHPDKFGRWRNQSQADMPMFHRRRTSPSVGHDEFTHRDGDEGALFLAQANCESGIADAEIALSTAPRYPLINSNMLSGSIMLEAPLSRTPERVVSDARFFVPLPSFNVRNVYCTCWA